MFFHRDRDHIYHFDESALQHGAIYGRKKRRDEKDGGAKQTARNLAPIKSASEFEHHIHHVSEVEYMRRGRNNRLQQVSAYIVELCVVLMKERKSTKASVPTSSIECNTGDALSISGAGATSQKRKQVPAPYLFPANKLFVSLYAPIETEQSKTNMKTGVPSGKTNKKLSYDLSPYIIGGKDDTSISSSDDKDEVDDEEFINSFTLSLFRKDLMVLAGDQFPEEYAVTKKSLGPKCKLFM